MQAIKLKTNLSNNQVKYEALLIRLEWAHEAHITALKVYSHSQLIVNHVQVTYAVQSKVCN